MKRKDIVYLITAWVCFVIWLMPLSVLNYFLPESKLRLVGLDGDISDGRVAELIVLHQGKWLNLGSLKWQLDPFSLLMFSAKGQVSGGGLSVSYQGDFKLSPSTLRLEEFAARFPASLIAKQAHIPANVAGDLELSLQKVEIDRSTIWPTLLDGQLTWSRAAAGIGGPAFALGDYGVRLGLDDQGRLAGNVQHLDGPLVIEGEWTLDKSRQLNANALLEQQQGLNPQVWQSLQLVAKPEGEKLRFIFDSKI